MTKEELIEFFKTENGKAIFEELTAEVTEGLKNKNNELIQKNKVLKTAKETAEAKVTELEEEAMEILSGKGKGKDIATQIEQKLQEKFAKKEKELQDKNDKYSKQINTLVVENGLTEALAANNIAKQHIPAVRALIKSTSKIEVSSEDDEAPVATIEGKALSDYVKEFAQGDSGKHYVAAPDNNGGGSKGSNNNASGKVDTSKLSAKEKINLGRAKAK